MTHETTFSTLLRNGARFLADGGLETAMIFHEGLDLPEFASFALLEWTAGRKAIERVDAETDSYPLFFMINCAYPDHFIDALRNGEKWIDRVGGVRANASRMSHSELDNAEELDEGNPAELAKQYRELTTLLPKLSVLGGCCGTDHRHIAAIGHACALDHAA